MTVPRLRTVTAPLLVVAVLGAGQALVAGCGAGQEAANAAVPADGPLHGKGGMQDASPTAGPTPSPTSSNGQTGISGQQYLAASQDAFAGATTVHVTGTAVRGADAYVVDAHLVSGKGGTATIKTSGQTVQVIRIGDDAYVGGDLAFWQSMTGDPARARSMVGTYVKTSATAGNFASFVAFTQPATYAAVMPGASGPATVGAVTTIGGRGAVAVRDAAGSTLYVATTGPAYPLRFDGLAGGQVVFLDFTDYGQPVQLTAPVTRKVAGTGIGS